MPTDILTLHRYAKAVLASEELDINLYGKTNIHISGLPTTKVTYNKKITMKGLSAPLLPLSH
jgi:hypothetical protein